MLFCALQVCRCLPIKHLLLLFAGTHAYSNKTMGSQGRSSGIVNLTETIAGETLRFFPFQEL